MNELITEIIAKHSDQLKDVDRTQPIAKIVKQIDHMVQDLYLELYGLRDGRKCLIKQEQSDKKGHCC